MELNEIKKSLYKEKPTATIIHVSKSGVLYSTYFDTGKLDEFSKRKYENVYFQVPIDDMGESAFLKDMPAQLLIRYIITEPTY